MRDRGPLSRSRRRGACGAFAHPTSEPDAELPDPGEPCIGVGAGLVLAADPTVIAERGEGGEDGRIGDLAFVGLGPARHRRDLHVTDPRHEALEALEHVALHDRDVIAVEHDLHIRPPDRRDDLVGPLDRGIEIARRVARVERLQEDREAVRGSFVGGARDVPDEELGRGVGLTG